MMSLLKQSAFVRLLRIFSPQQNHASASCGLDLYTLKCYLLRVNGIRLLQSSPHIKSLSLSANPHALRRRPLAWRRCCHTTVPTVNLPRAILQKYGSINSPSFCRSPLECCYSPVPLISTAQGTHIALTEQWPDT